MLMRMVVALLLSAFMLASAGCASILISGASSGIEYTLTNIAYKTINFPISEVRIEMHKTLERMGIKEISMQSSGKDVEIVSQTMDLKIHIELEWVTNSTTRIKVDARRNLLLKDKSTATAIIEQTERNLKERDLPLRDHEKNSGGAA